MLVCRDLVYKLAVQNTTENPILYRITFKEDPENKANLKWPINGFKGSLEAG